MNFHRIVIALCGLALANVDAMNQSSPHTIGNAIFSIKPTTQPVRTRDFMLTGLESEVENIPVQLGSGSAEIIVEIAGALEKLKPYHENNTTLIDLLKGKIESVYDTLKANTTDAAVNLSGGYLISVAFNQILQNNPEVKRDLTIITNELTNVGVTVLEDGKIEFDLEDAISAAIGCCGFLLRKK